jgi:MarR family transcriptional regulator, organic hydroperoxide resistance regulator
MGPNRILSIMRNGMKVQGVAPTKGRGSAGIRPGRAGRQPKGDGRAGNGSGATQRNVAELQALQSLRLIYASARWHDAQVRRSVAISGSQLWALSEIARREGMGVNDLAERMALHQTTASNLANALAKKDLIRRVRDGSDRRFVHLHLTSKGRLALKQSPGPHPGLLVDALRKIDSPHLGRLRRDLAALVRLMRRTTAKAAGETLLGE